MPKPNRTPLSPAPRGPGDEPPEAPDARYWLKLSLTLCLFTLAALACCHLLLTTGGS